MSMLKFYVINDQKAIFLFYFFPVLSSSYSYLSRKPYPYHGHLLLLGHVHPSQLLHCKLSLIADDEVVARVVFLVVLRIKVYEVTRRHGTLFIRATLFPVI